jgi:hypothetical protein
MRKQSEHPTTPAIEIIYCPKCKDQPMLIVAVKPLLLASGVEEIHYKCKECGSQDMRILAPHRY